MRILVSDPSELPDPGSISELYLELLVVTHDADVAPDRPWFGHQVAGYAFTWDDSPNTWYVPVRHRRGRAVERRVAEALVRRLVRLAGRWVSHDPKRARHFLEAEGVPCGGVEMVCTRTLAKTLDSDRASHDLEDLCSGWVGVQATATDRAVDWMRGVLTPDGKRGVKDPGLLPLDLASEAMGERLQMTRKLWRHLQSNRPTDMERLWRIEIDTTPVLWSMESRGLAIDLEKTEREYQKAWIAEGEIESRFVSLTGIELQDRPECYQEALVDVLGLPVLRWNVQDGRRRGASFDKEALAAYAALPETQSNKRAADVVALVGKYRSWKHYRSHFLEPFITRNVRGLLHPTYNQSVRTGRLSTKDPNSQGFDDRALALIVPRDEGKKFVCVDAAQNEFRIMLHATGDGEPIAAFRQDPRTDFHEWVAKFCGMSRRQGKTVNFMMGFGAGEGAIVDLLMADPDIRAEVNAKIDKAERRGEAQPHQRPRLYRRLCEDKARAVLGVYMTRLPGVAATRREWAEVARTQGYVRNPYGRRRHLREGSEHAAFPSWVQGWAMDLIKERMVAAHRYGFPQLANKHDEILLEVPRDWPVVEEDVAALYANTELELAVPMVWDVGSSDRNWKEAKP